MAKAPAFTCSACGAAHRKWAGRCEACGAWNAIIEESPLSQGPGPKALTAKGRTIALTDLATEEAPPPRVGSGTPITAAAAMSGWRISRVSTSSGKTL